MPRVIATLLLVASLMTLVFIGYRWGERETDNAWQTKEAKRLKSEADARESEIRRGDKASGALQAELQDQAITNDRLTKAFNDYKKRNPIQARRAAVAPACQPETVADGPAGHPDPGITLGAVWMWNSALAGVDAPAGACGLADQSESACAADSGISLQDAWDNQALNARICAQDRLRHQRLIDFVKGKP